MAPPNAKRPTDEVAEDEPPAKMFKMDVDDEIDFEDYVVRVKGIRRLGAADEALEKMKKKTNLLDGELVMLKSVRIADRVPVLLKLDEMTDRIETNQDNVRTKSVVRQKELENMKLTVTELETEFRASERHEEQDEDQEKEKTLIAQAMEFEKLKATVKTCRPEMWEMTGLTRFFDGLLFDRLVVEQIGEPAAPVSAPEAHAVETPEMSRPVDLLQRDAPETEEQEERAEQVPAVPQNNVEHLVMAPDALEEVSEEPEMSRLLDRDAPETEEQEEKAPAEPEEQPMEPPAPVPQVNVEHIDLALEAPPTVAEEPALIEPAVVIEMTEEPTPEEPSTVAENENEDVSLEETQEPAPEVTPDNVEHIISAPEAPSTVDDNETADLEETEASEVTPVDVTAPEAQPTADENEDVVILEEDEEPAPAAEPRERSSSTKIAYIVANARHAESPCDMIKMIPGRWVAQIPEECSGVLRAHQSSQSSWTRPEEHRFPGLGHRKFGKSNEQDGHQQELSEIQGVLRVRTGTRMVSRAGWTADTMKTLADDEEVPPMIEQLSAYRARYLKTFKGFRTLLAEPNHPFWMHEEMSYLHSVQNLRACTKDYDGRGGLVTYMSDPAAEPTMVLPPRYSFSEVSIVDKRAYDVCRADYGNKSYAELSRLPENQHILEQPKPKTKRKERKNLCENAKGCVCDKRFEMVYGRMDPKPANRKLIFCHTVRRHVIDTSNTDEFIRNPGVVMECTDACGCSHKCPRRHMQQGFQADLIVSHEGADKGYGLRAAHLIKKGSLIVEYKGVLYVKTRRSDGDAYEMACDYIVPQVVIGSAKIGNASRFINHACDPNAMFVQVDSRPTDDQHVRIPRVGLFAIRNIQQGEEITCQYWDVSRPPSDDEEWIECKCGTVKCVGRLPMATIEIKEEVDA